MGLTVSINGYPGETYDCGYITFGIFRQRLAEAYNPVFGDIYRKWYEGTVKEEECEKANKIIENDKGLDLFLSHSDCDGKFSYQECRMIYNDIKDMKLDMIGHNYGSMKPYNMLERWKDMFKWCADHRRVMRFE